MERIRSSSEVCREAKITYRQLNHWIYAGYIPGQSPYVGSGIPRVWTEDDFARVLEIRDAYLAADLILQRAGLRVAESHGAAWRRPKVLAGVS